MSSQSVLVSCCAAHHERALDERDMLHLACSGQSATRTASARRAALTSASFSKNEPLATIKHTPLTDHGVVEHERLGSSPESKILPCSE